MTNEEARTAQAALRNAESRAQLRSFSVWFDHNEQWDPEDIDPPTRRVQAVSAEEAAKKLASDDDPGDGIARTLIVRDDAANTFRQIEVVREWRVNRDMPITLEELSSP